MVRMKILLVASVLVCTISMPSHAYVIRRKPVEAQQDVGETSEEIASVGGDGQRRSKLNWLWNLFKRNQEEANNKNGNESPGEEQEAKSTNNPTTKKPKSTNPTTKKPAMNDKKIKEYLVQYGYAKESNGTLNQTILDKSLKKVSGFRKLKNVNENQIKAWVGEMLSHQRCGDPDIGGGAFGRHKHGRKKRYATQTPWSKNNLTYKIDKYGNDLTVQVQQDEIRKAFKMWADAAPALAITEVQANQSADINIQFATGTHHGCPIAFDGPGLVVGHAFYPEDGRVHFDDDEKFTTGSDPSKVYLLSIAAHEIGHALGLGHSSDDGSIMHPEYQPYNSNLALAQDDINGINALYPTQPSGDCTDEIWCEDILPDECSDPFFSSSCKTKCNVC